MYSCVLVCYLYVTRMYSCITRMLLVCTRMLLVCTRVYSYVTRMYSYVTRHNRFKRADSSTTYVAVLVFLSASTILKNFVAAVDKHLPRIFSFNLLCRIMKYCMFSLYNAFWGSTSTAELLLKANPVACLTRQSAFSATNN